MKISTQIVILSCFIFFGLYMHDKPAPIPVQSFNRTVDVLKPAQSEHKLIVKPKFKGRLSEFLQQLGKIEGFGSYTTVSSRGYLGLYQFHPKTLSFIGINATPTEFLSNPELQDSAAVTYMRINARSLDKIIRHYSGTYYNGVYVTKAGILAGAHLVGVGGILAFFHPEKYEYKTVDGNGVHVSNYMNQFAGYDLRGF